MASSHLLSAPLSCTGKRSRSNSSSSSASSSAASSTGASIFSHLTSADSLSSCSSPAVSNEASPYSSGQEDERPSKTLRTERSTSTDLALDGLEKKCSLRSEESDSSRQSSSEPEKTSSTGKTVFVDCLVDAAVHVLDTIWEAPLHRSIAFVCDDTSYSTTIEDESESDKIARSCVCPVGRPMTAGIPLDLFIRETLRRSRTSCSTLQAALLFCKRVGGEVIRRRAEREGISLSAEDLERLPGSTNTYASLQSLTSSSPNDYILCARRIFLASVMVSSKFLQDRTFSNRAWSKISGLNVRELCVVERRLLMALEFDLNVCEQSWTSWTCFLKGDWRVGGTKSFHHSTPRRTLERTSSLQVEGVYDTDVTLPIPSGEEKTIFLNEGLTYSPLSAAIATPTLATTSPIVRSDTATPTPNQSQTIKSGETTPTSTKTHRLPIEHRKQESSLLSTALHNHIMMGVEGGTHLTSDLPLPFPIRKGLANRSISTF